MRRRRQLGAPWANPLVQGDTGVAFLKNKGDPREWSFLEGTVI